ncbi:MAG: PqqD family protein [Blastocatellia bacterium]
MQTTIVTKEQASFTELLDNEEAIILDLETLHYYTLNAAAIFLWKHLRTGSANTLEELTISLATAFRINADLAELDTRAFLDELEGNGLISYLEGATPAYTNELDAASGCLPVYEPPQLQLSNSLAQVALSGSGTAAVAAIGGGGSS